MVTYWEISAHSAYDMFSWYKYLIVNLVFFHLGFWSGNLFLIAPFPDRCLLNIFNFYNFGKICISHGRVLVLNVFVPKCLVRTLKASYFILRAPKLDTLKHRRTIRFMSISSKYK